MGATTTPKRNIAGLAATARNRKNRGEEFKSIDLSFYFGGDDGRVWISASKVGKPDRNGKARIVIDRGNSGGYANELEAALALIEIMRHGDFSEGES